MRVCVCGRENKHNPYGLYDSYPCTLKYCKPYAQDELLLLAGGEAMSVLDMETGSTLLASGVCVCACELVCVCACEMAHLRACTRARARRGISACTSAAHTQVRALRPPPFSRSCTRTRSESWHRSLVNSPRFSHGHPAILASASLDERAALWDVRAGLRKPVWSRELEWGAVCLAPPPSPPACRICAFLALCAV